MRRDSAGIISIIYVAGAIEGIMKETLQDVPASFFFRSAGILSPSLLLWRSTVETSSKVAEIPSLLGSSSVFPALTSEATVLCSRRSFHPSTM